MDNMDIVDNNIVDENIEDENSISGIQDSNLINNKNNINIIENVNSNETDNKDISSEVTNINSIDNDKEQINSKTNDDITDVKENNSDITIENVITETKENVHIINNNVTKETSEVKQQNTKETSGEKQDILTKNEENILKSEPVIVEDNNKDKENISKKKQTNESIPIVKDKKKSTDTKDTQDVKETIKKYYSMASNFAFKFKANNPGLFKIIIASLVITLIFPKLLFFLLFLITGFVLGLMYIVPTRDMESMNNIKANGLNELKKIESFNTKVSEIQKPKERQIIVLNSSNDFSPEMRLALDNFLIDFNKNFIDKWWVKLNHSNTKEFNDDITFVLNEAFSIMNLYARNVSITSLIVPIFNHLIEQMQLYREYENSGLTPSAYLQKHSYSKLSKYSTRDSEIKILRDLGALIVNQVLDTKEKNCQTVFTFIQEIMATSVLLPVVEKLADPYFINNLIYTKLGDNPKSKKKPTQKHSLSHKLSKKNSQLSIKSTISNNDNQNNYPPSESSFDQLNDSYTGQIDQQSELSLSLSDSNMPRITFEEGIKDERMLSEFNIFLKEQELDELLYLYIQIEQFKSHFSNNEYDIEIVENYGNNIINNFIYTDRKVLINNLIHPYVLEKYHIRIDNNILRGNLFDDLQNEVANTINQKYWPIFLKDYDYRYNNEDENNSNADFDNNENSPELENEIIIMNSPLLPPNARFNIEEYSIDDQYLSHKDDTFVNSFINSYRPIKQKLAVTTRYNIYRHRRRLSESDSIILQSFGIDYINKMNKTYGSKYIIKDHKRIDRHLDHLIHLSEEKVNHYINEIAIKKSEVTALDQTIEHILTNFNGTTAKDEELFQTTMQKMTSKKMEYQMEIEELNQVRASMETKISELKEHQIFKAKYKIIIIDPLQESIISNMRPLPMNYRFNLEVYNIININEKYDFSKMYKELYDFHLKLKLKYKNIPDFPSYEYLIYKKKVFRDHLISRNALPKEKHESSFTDIYQITTSELVQELESYFNILSNIPIIGENPDFVRFITNYKSHPTLAASATLPVLPSRDHRPASATNPVAYQHSLPDTENDRGKRKLTNDKRMSNASLSSMMSFIKPTRSHRKAKSSSFSFSRLNEKINDKINDKLFNINTNTNSSSNGISLLSKKKNTSPKKQNMTVLPDRAPPPPTRNRFSQSFSSNATTNTSNSINNNNYNNININNISDNNNNSNNNNNNNNNISPSNSSRTGSFSEFLSKRNDQDSITDVQSETSDSVKNTKNEEINMSQEAIDMILECIICLVEEIFQLNNPDQWMRQKAFQVVKQVALKSFSSKINNILCAFLGKVFSEESFTKYVNKLTQSLFHKDENKENKNNENQEGKENKEKKKKKEVSYEEKERVKYHAKNILLTSNKIPLHYISKVVGTRNTQNGVTRLFEMFQVPEFNRHLMCAILQSVVICVFDNDDIEVQRKKIN
ncbi:hypothetical protein BCR32DRAFT_288786 [Anaeromyces robustus]|uniref:PXA domain-containing protein n=1 Tax=Anaeromyces robustus TaxID=1754192 RepID=A0A1Y1XRA3_9FUNG|nr:hypothetical protein BCR32DRAFT_288786 [Anaeromyces robustus]|eukprot:ORX88280.1 hypothetical protein BCR32DRAFT_288786 [Anaeromyces robustus]